MSFLLQPSMSREVQYPNAQDKDFLGYDRSADRWKVDASGIHLYASGISVDLDYKNDSVAVWSASGTTDIPVYLTSDLDHNNDSVSVMSSSGTTDVPVYITSPVEVEVDIGDSIKSLSASGTAASEVWINDPVAIYPAAPLDAALIKTRVSYNANGDPTQVKKAVIATPSGSQCVVKTIAYSDDDNPEYITDSLGTW